MALFDRIRRKKEAAPEASSAAAGEPTSEPPVNQTASGPRESTQATAEQTPASPKGVLARLKQGLKKTSDLLNTDVRDLFKQDGQLLDEGFLDKLFEVLVRTDMGAGPAREIRTEIEEKYRGRVVFPDNLVEDIKGQLKSLILQEQRPITLASSGPTVIVVVGVNGAGKTTSIAKLANRFIEEGNKVILGAGDTFRAAAVEQLTIWAQRIGAEIITGKPGGDPASVAHRAVAKAIEDEADICIVDTAGRLQTQVNLMEQLTKIRRVISKQIPDAPHEVLLVLDATAGQNGISQARGFSEAIDCTGIILAKLDGTAKGGVIIPIRQQFDLPVKFVGVGEQVSDLAEFESDKFIDALFDEFVPSAS